jgi:hypothetical protein
MVHIWAGVYIPYIPAHYTHYRQAITYAYRSPCTSLCTLICTHTSMYWDQTDMLCTYMYNQGHILETTRKHHMDDTHVHMYQICGNHNQVPHISKPGTNPTSQDDSGQIGHTRFLRQVRGYTRKCFWLYVGENNRKCVFSHT